MRTSPAVAALLLVSTACAPEVTTPQGAAATAAVVPIAVPDQWCPAVPDTVPKNERQCHQYPVPHAPAATVIVDSTRWDSTGRR